MFVWGIIAGMDSFELLVSLLSIVLIVLLVLIIVIAIYAIKVMRHVDDISNKAARVMDSVESVGKVFEKSAGPVAISRIFANIFESFKDSKSKKKEK